MASDDVIELGSSDEDTEPAPKKRKPPPNAMVHVPGKLSGITITPSKSSTKINPACIVKGSIGKSVTVTKVPKSNVNPYANARKLNGKPAKSQPAVKQLVQIPIQKSVALPVIHNTGSILNMPMIHKVGINPLNKPGVKTYSKIIPINTPGVNPLNMVKIMKTNTPMQEKIAGIAVKGLNPINSTVLPAGITLKRTIPTASKSNIDVKRLKLPSTIVRMSKPKIIATNEVLTVDLDDDEPATSSGSGPQWYLRPEEQEKRGKQKTPQKSLNPLEDKSPKDQKPGKSPEKSQIQSPDKPTGNSLVALEPTDVEQQNNKEPDKTTFIEITIEDSPIKPAYNRKGFKVGAELAITIEDSPIKVTADKSVPSCDSHEESVSRRDPNSKKKLEYPKNVEIETVEIEFEPLSVEEPTRRVEEPTNRVEESTSKVEKPMSNIEKTKSKEEKPISKVEKPMSKVEKTKSSEEKPISKVEKPMSNTEIRNEKIKVAECIDIVEIEESPIKSPDMVQTTTPKKNMPAKPAPDYKMTKMETVVLDDKEKDEFHPIYQSFINLCFQMENSEDMKKIVEKKIKSYYRQVPKEYTESEAFIDMVSSKIMAIKAGPEKMYLYIKDIVDELNLQRKLAKSQPSSKETKNEEQEKFLYGEESEFDLKRQRQIRKLEKTLKKLHRAIQKLEEQEVDFDDEEDSVYLLTESEDDTSSKDDKPLNKEVLLQRYKERMVRVHAKLCQLTNTKMPSEARVQIDARPGQPKGPAKRLEKWINKKVPIGTPLPFPDFHDVLRCVRDANQADKLGWNEADIMEEARDLFTRCGKKLQRRRQENEWRLAASRIPVDVVDPAEDSIDLKKKLEENRRVASKKETEVFNKYADRQNLLKLEAVEIGDKEAEESPIESDDEDPVEDTDSLTNKEKRKERLKRLLQEKSKKVSGEKENQLEDQPVVLDNSQNKDAAIKDSNEAGNSSKGTDEQGDVENKDKDPLELELPQKGPLNSDLPEKDSKDGVQSGLCSKSKDDNGHRDEIHSLSEDSNKVESDVDELHLLQKLYSENEFNTSVVDSSDTGTPIAISDTSSNESSDEQRTKKQTSDVISIENSSFSESEEKKGDFSKDIEIETNGSPTKNPIDENMDTNLEIECSNDNVGKKTNKTSNHEYSQCLEDILLASSDDADDTDARKNNPDRETCINLKDDNISIGETVIEKSKDHCSNHKSKADNHSDRKANTDSSSVEGMETDPTELNSKEQNGHKNNTVETASIKSVESIEDVNANEATSIKSVESIEDGNVIETANVKSVESIEDLNANETKTVKSVESIEDGNVIKTNVKSVDTIEDENVSETKCITSIEKETIIKNSGDSSRKEIAIDTTKNIDTDFESNAEEATKDKGDSIPEAMEMNSQVEQT